MSRVQAKVLIILCTPPQSRRRHNLHVAFVHCSPILRRAQTNAIERSWLSDRAVQMFAISLSVCVDSQHSFFHLTQTHINAATGWAVAHSSVPDTFRFTNNKSKNLFHTGISRDSAPAGQNMELISWTSAHERRHLQKMLVVRCTHR